MGSYQLREAHTSQDVEFKIQWSRTRICPEDGDSRLSKMSVTATGTTQCRSAEYRNLKFHLR
jgi:hypothetical protein